MVYTLILHKYGPTPSSVAALRNTYGALISLMEVFIYKQNITLSYAPFGDVCLHS